MTETPKEVFARRLKRYRERRGWTQEDLARELDKAGWTVPRSMVAKIEAGARGISLDEAISLSWVLGLPPSFLYLPLGEGHDIALTPDGATVDPEAARQWALGRVPAMSSDQYVRMPGEWRTDLEPWRLFDALADASRANHDAQAKVVSASNFGDDDQKREANAAYVRALESLHDVLQAIRGAGLVPPAQHERTVEAMRRAGRDYDGPTYPGPERNDES